MSNIASFNFILAGIIFALGGAAFALWPTAIESQVSATASPYCADITPELNLMAHAAYAIDLQTGLVLYEKNANAQLPLASLTKVMTVVTVLDSFAPNDVIEIPDEALGVEGESGFVKRERWKVQDLIDFTLISSSNDGAHALFLVAGQKRGKSYGDMLLVMNNKAKYLNMGQTYFANDTGLDVAESSAGALGSAHDVAQLLAYVFQKYPTEFENSSVQERTFVSESGVTHKVKNTTGASSVIPEVILSKTGFTDLAGGNLALVFEPILGRPVAAVVLGSTREGRDIDMQILAQGAKAAIKKAILCGK